jgi:hypothetical protein
MIAGLWVEIWTTNVNHSTVTFVLFPPGIHWLGAQCTPKPVWPRWRLSGIEPGHLARYRSVYWMSYSRLSKLWGCNVTFKAGITTLTRSGVIFTTCYRFAGCKFINYGNLLKRSCSLLKDLNHTAFQISPAIAKGSILFFKLSPFVV